MSSEEVLPSVIFVSCSGASDVEKLINIVNPKKEIGCDAVWKIDTKYYEATVQLVPVPVANYESLTAEVVENAGGLVLYYDGDFERCSIDVKKAVEKLEECDAGVKLLVCNSCQPEGSRVLAEEWCVEQGFEHLELDGPEGDESRLQQALEAHVWPNLVHKADSSKSKGNKKTEKPAESTAAADDDFSTLFQHLATMKEQAAGLPPDERKNFAEQVVLAYWRSIGGDEDELLDV